MTIRKTLGYAILAIIAAAIYAAAALVMGPALALVPFAVAGIIIGLVCLAICLIEEVP